jgi:hypothetical protein
VALNQEYTEQFTASRLSLPKIRQLDRGGATHRGIAFAYDEP